MKQNDTYYPFSLRDSTAYAVTANEPLYEPFALAMAAARFAEAFSLT